MYTAVIITTFVAFCGLAAILLIPIHRFLKQEDAMLDEVTEEELYAEARRRDARDHLAESDGVESD